MTAEPVIWMTGSEAREIRHRLGLSLPKMSALLRLADGRPHGERTLRRWERGEVSIPGPMAVAIEALGTGWRPKPREAEKLLDIGPEGL